MTLTEIKSNLQAIAYMLESLEKDENFKEICKDDIFDGSPTLDDAIHVITNLKNCLEVWQAP